MRLVGYDPFVNPERAEELGVELMELDDLMAQADFLTLHLARTPETMNLINAERLALAKPNLRVINVARGGIVNEEDLAAAIADGKIAGAALDVFDSEPKTESPLFELPQVVVTPHLGASTAEAQTRAGETIAEQVRLALDGDFVPFAVNVNARGVSETVRPFLPLAELLGAQFARLVENPSAVDVVFAGEIGGMDCRMAELAITKGLMSQLTNEPVSYVNAEDLAQARGLKINARATTKTPSGLVNGIKIEGDGHSLAGTIDMPTGKARIISVDGITINMPSSENLLLVLNEDTPGMIGRVGTIFGEAEINIDDMHLGQSSPGEVALIALTTTVPIPEVIVAKLNELPRILSVKDISVPH